MKKTLASNGEKVTVTEEQELQLNAIKSALKELVEPGVIVNGEFVAGTRDNDDYLAFVYFANIYGLPNDRITHRRGIELTKLDQTDICVAEIITSVKKQDILYLFKR